MTEVQEKAIRESVAEAEKTLHDSDAFCAISITRLCHAVILLQAELAAKAGENARLISHIKSARAQMPFEGAAYSNIWSLCDCVKNELEAALSASEVPK